MLATSAGSVARPQSGADLRQPSADARASERGLGPLPYLSIQSRAMVGEP